ncbi:VOC family protein [Mycolicibacterium llatzerense]
MKQQVHFFTLATVDLDATRQFYTALGWTPTLDVPGEIIFYQTAPGQLLGFFLAEKFNADLAQAADHSQVSGITLAHNVDSQDEVIELAAAMTGAGGTTLKRRSPGSSAGCSTRTSRIRTA